MRLLVIEDDKDINRQIVAALEHAGYAVDHALDGEEGHFLGETEPYDAIVLDIGLPKKDGITILEAWRASGRMMPVLILTARDRWSEKVQGFDAGADDYLAKPFHMEELLARIRALPVADAWTLWGGALWRAALPCVAVMAALGVWTMVAVFSGADNGALDIEGTLIANVEQSEQLDPMTQIQ